MNNEKLENHIVVLKNKHHELDKRIEVLYHEKANEMYITPLKKEKLRLKEEIVTLEQKLL